MKHFLLLPTLLLFSLLVAACVDDGDRAAAPDPTVTQAPEPTPEVYVAQPGDYLALIADKLDVPLSQLLELNDIPDPSTIKIGQEIVIREAAPLPDLPPPAVTTDAPASEIATEEDARWPFGVTSDQARLAALGTAALAATFALLLFLRAAVRVIVGYGSRVGRRIARRQTASGQSGADTSLIAADPNRSRGWLRRAFSALGRQSVAVLRRVATGLRALPAVIGRLAARLRGLLRRSSSAGRPGGAAALATTARSSGGLRRSRSRWQPRRGSRRPAWHCVCPQYASRLAHWRRQRSATASRTTPISPSCWRQSWTTVRRGAASDVSPRRGSR